MSQSSDVSMQSNGSVKSAENASTSSMEVQEKMSADSRSERDESGLNIDAIIEQLLSV